MPRNADFVTFILLAFSWPGGRRNSLVKVGLEGTDLCGDDVLLLQS